MILTKLNYLKLIENTKNGKFLIQMLQRLTATFVKKRPNLSNKSTFWAEKEVKINKKHWRNVFFLF